MSEIKTDLVHRLVKERKSDGRCVYDAGAKAEIVRACMQPGVSVARIAMQAGINANMVRAWIVKTRNAVLTSCNEPVSRSDGGAAFIPLRLGVDRADPAPGPPAMLRLHVRLPKRSGVRPR